MPLLGSLINNRIHLKWPYATPPLGGLNNHIHLNWPHAMPPLGGLVTIAATLAVLCDATVRWS